ncbi:MAG: hypothetical protein JW395_0785 [Nitrospira sp.]|nr:hypothetical protein [Nitrospira sp.]
MTIKSTEPTGEPQRPASSQETVVTHGANQDTTEHRSVGSATATAAPAPAMATSRTVVRDEVGVQHSKVAQITQIVWFIVGFLEVVLAIRLILKLTAAGQTDFTQVVLGFTRPFVMPFLGMFPNAAADSFEFEPASLVAMGVYFLIGIAVAKLVRILYGETREIA